MGPANFSLLAEAEQLAADPGYNAARYTAQAKPLIAKLAGAVKKLEAERVVTRVLPTSLRTSLLREVSRMLPESQASELRDNGGHGDFDAGAGQGRAFLAAEILATFPNEQE